MGANPNTGDKEVQKHQTLFYLIHEDRAIGRKITSSNALVLLVYFFVLGKTPHSPNSLTLRWLPHTRNLHPRPRETETRSVSAFVAERSSLRVRKIHNPWITPWKSLNIKHLFEKVSSFSLKPFSTSSWCFFNQPIWEIYALQIGSSQPRIGWKSSNKYWSCLVTWFSVAKHLFVYYYFSWLLRKTLQRNHFFPTPTHLHSVEFPYFSVLLFSPSIVMITTQWC